PLDIYACVQDRAAMTPKVKAFISYLSEYLEIRWPKENIFTDV
ncbi:MAG: LysR family transcriptional regulator, partial [Pseudomonas helleri]